jgi:hypothetical protein
MRQPRSEELYCKQWVGYILPALSRGLSTRQKKPIPADDAFLKIHFLQDFELFYQCSSEGLLLF